MKIKTISFEKKSNDKLYIQLYHTIIKQIMNGYMKEGDQLPSIRMLSKQLNLSKTTIENAYEMLLAEGYIISKPQVGYFIDVTLDGRWIKPNIELIDYEETNKEEYLYDFSSQSIDKDIFDINLWKKYIKNVLEKQDDIISYGNPQGEYQLRMQLSSYAYRVRGVQSHSNAMVIGAGIQPLLYILSGLFQKKSVKIGIEESGFKQAQRVFHDCRFEIVKIKMSDEGINLDDLNISDIDILYLNTTSSGHLQRRMSAPLRFEILSIAKKKNIYIIEDDHNGELCYRSRMIPAMQGFDQHGHVIYIGSFSKLLLPSIRIAYMVLPKALHDIYQLHKSSYNQTSSKIEQLALAQYIEEGQLERHLRRLRKHYASKSLQLVAYIKKYFNGYDYELQETNLRIQLIGPFNQSIDKILLEAKMQGIYIKSYMNKDLLLSFSGIPLDRMEVACEKLSTICLNN